MQNLKQCREKLGTFGKQLTDEEVLEMRDYLYKLARINIQYIKETLKANGQESNSVYKGINR